MTKDDVEDKINLKMCKGVNMFKGEELVVLVTFLPQDFW